MKHQKIFYYHRDTKIVVKPKSDKTVYEFKLGERDIFIIEVPLNDHHETRKIVNNYLERLSLH